MIAERLRRPEVRWLIAVLVLACSVVVTACDRSPETRVTIVNRARSEAGLRFDESSDVIYLGAGETVELPPIQLRRVSVFLGRGFDSTTPSVEHEFGDSGGELTIEVHGSPVRIEVKD